MYLTESDKAEAHSDTLGGRLTSARESQDLSTAQLARRLGVESQTLKEWENDQAEPRANRLTMLAGFLNVSPTWLLTGAGESPSEALSETEIMQMQASIERLREQLTTVTDELAQLQERLGTYHSFQ